MIADVLDICPDCGRRPSRLAIAGDGSLWRVRCGCGHTWLEHMVGDSRHIPEPLLTPTAEDLRTRELVHRLLEESEPAAGTLVEMYLRSRGIGAVLPVLRFAPRLRHTPSNSWLPAMIAPVVNVNGEIIGLHRTFLDPAGQGKAAVEPHRMMLGHCAGGAVRLAEAAGEVAASEGIETGISVAEIPGIPVWCALSTSGLIALELPPLPLARSVIILADHDAAGIAAAKKAAARWYAEGRRVKIAMPPTPGADFNDVARGASA